MEQHSSDRSILLETLHKYDELRETLLQDIERRDRDERLRNYKDTQTWLAASSPSHEHEQARDKRRYEGHSGDWLLEKPEVKDWKDSDTPDSSYLWLNGMPGAGRLVRLLVGL